MRIDDGATKSKAIVVGLGTMMQDDDNISTTTIQQQTEKTTSPSIDFQSLNIDPLLAELFKGKKRNIFFCLKQQALKEKWKSMVKAWFGKENLTF